MEGNKTKKQSSRGSHARGGPKNSVVPFDPIYGQEVRKTNALTGARLVTQIELNPDANNDWIQEQIMYKWNDLLALSQAYTPKRCAPNGILATNDDSFANGLRLALGLAAFSTANERRSFYNSNNYERKKARMNSKDDNSFGEELAQALGGDQVPDEDHDEVDNLNEPSPSQQQPTFSINSLEMPTLDCAHGRKITKINYDHFKP